MVAFENKAKRNENCREQFPAFLTPETGFMGDNFSIAWGPVKGKVLR